MALDTSPSSTGVLLSSDNKDSQIPTILFDMITLDEGVSTPILGRPQTSNLIVNLKMHIEIPVASSDNDILKNIGVCVVRCTSAQAAKYIESTGKIPKKVQKIYEGPLKNLLGGTDINIIGSSPKEVFETSSGKRIFNISFQKNDKLAATHPVPHLSYYAFCYLDLKSLVESLGIEDIPSLGPTIGPISGENVISVGKVNITSYVFFITSPFPENLSGTYWTGPVLQDKAGKWGSARLAPGFGMEAGLLPTNPPMDLDRIQVRNSKIQDFRILRQIPNLNFDLIPSNFSPIIIKGRDNFNNSIQNPDAYISNAFLTRDLHNNCRFIFEFDYDRALVRESKFGKILTNPFVPKETKKKIYNYSPITSLRIVRRRVETVRGYNRLSSPSLGINNSEIEPEELVIVETASDPERNNTLKRVVLVAPDTGRRNRESQAVASVMELLSLKNSPKHTRTISVTDNSISQIQNGTHQYGVKIEMEDGSIRFLNERLKRLRTLRTYLKEYYELKQIPKKSYQTISSIKDYYDIIFSSGPPPIFTPVDPFGAPHESNFNRASFADKIEINNLRTELGFLVGNLDPRETLYPWVIVPEYLVDTLESISDFSYITKSKNIQNTQIMQTPAAQFNSPDAEPPEILGRPTGLARLNEVDSGARDYGIGASQGVSLDSFDRIDSDPSAPTATQMRAIDLFDEKAARFALRSLLDPRSSTSESILQVIGILDMLTQKIRIMMGSSAQIEEVSVSTRRQGVAQNSKVSVLNLNDYFIELFDASLSILPAVDHIGFKRSAGRTHTINSTGGYSTVFAAGSSINGLDVNNITGKHGGDAGPLGMTVDSLKAVVEDERAIDDAIDQAEAEFAAAPGAPADDPREPEAIRQAAPPTKEKTARTVRKAQQTDSDELIITPTVFDDRQGGIIEVTTTTKNWLAPEQYVNMQNAATAIAVSETPSFASTNQDRINITMSTLNVEVLPMGTPMAVQESLNTGQNRDGQTVSVGDILGTGDRQTLGTANAQNNTCVPGTDGGDGSTDLAMCKDENNAQRATQTLMNLLAENKAFSAAFDRTNGNPTMLKDIYKKKNKKKEEGPPQSRSSTYNSPRENLIYGMPAKITIFMGYEKDSQGGIMIKRPIFKSPASWQEAMARLKRSSDPSDVLLCKLEPSDPDGPRFVETNVYFLVTKDKNTLAAQVSGHQRSKAETPKRDMLKNIIRERNIPPKALKSIYIAKTGGEK